ncbi:MAG: acyltransferase family protein [Burkholderiales bacterium]
MDGLRAVAVLAVLIHHISAAFLPGGFIGVDIFFVISGYLITSQVFKESLDDKFSLREFYKRRINRIIPALLLVLMVSLVVGCVLLSPADLVRLTKSAIYAMVGMSNVFFWREYGNYFAGTASEAPLLHTWSLGVEEQFYLLWPLIIVLLVRFARRYVVVILVIATIGAVAVSEVAVGKVASASYYLLPARFFELMIGGVLALMARNGRRPSPMLATACAAVGLALIGGSLWLLDKAASFPGLNALWPCLGAALLIWAGGAQHGLSRILTNRPMVSIGLISYSLYLWHWPIIAYLNYTHVAISPLVAVLVASASIGLAWLSWKFVEVPLRKTGASRAASGVVLWRFALPVAVVASIGLVAARAEGFPGRFDARVAAYERVLEAKPDLLRKGCHVPTALYDTPPSPACRLGSDKPVLDGILIGDSYANHFTGMLDVMAKAQGLSLMDYTMDGCPPLLGFDNGAAPSYAERCRKRNESAFAQVTNGHFSHVILAANWPRQPDVMDKLMRSIETVLKTGAELTIVLANNGIDRASSCPVRSLMYRSRDTCEGAKLDAPSYFNQIRARYPIVHVVDPNQVICAGQVCSPLLDGVLIYRDGGHLNDVGSRLLGQSLLRIGVSL